jgi:hypothetical protein
MTMNDSAKVQPDQINHSFQGHHQFLPDVGPVSRLAPPSQNAQNGRNHFVPFDQSTDAVDLLFVLPSSGEEPWTPLRSSGHSRSHSAATYEYLRIESNPSAHICGYSNPSRLENRHTSMSSLGAYLNHLSDSLVTLKPGSELVNPPETSASQVGTGWHVSSPSNGHIPITHNPDNSRPMLSRYLGDLAVPLSDRYTQYSPQQS